MYGQPPYNGGAGGWGGAEPPYNDGVAIWHVAAPPHPPAPPLGLNYPQFQNLFHHSNPNFPVQNPNFRGFTVQPNPNLGLIVEKADRAVKKARRDLIVAGENVSAWKVSQNALVMLKADSWESLGLKMQQVPSLYSLILIEGKIVAYIHCFVAVLRVTTLYDLEAAICKNEGVEQFEELELGPLLKHPLIVHYFSINPGLSEVFRITSEEIMSFLSEFMDANGGTDMKIDELLNFIAEKKAAGSIEKLGVRIQSLGMHIAFIQQARQFETSTKSKYMGVAKKEFFKFIGKRPIRSAPKKQSDKNFISLSSDSEDASSDSNQDETENIKSSDRPSICPYPSASVEIMPLGLKAEVGELDEFFISTSGHITSFSSANGKSSVKHIRFISSDSEDAEMTPSGLKAEVEELDDSISTSERITSFSSANGKSCGKHIRFKSSDSEDAEMTPLGLRAEVGELDDNFISPSESITPFSSANGKSCCKHIRFKSSDSEDAEMTPSRVKAEVEELDDNLISKSERITSFSSANGKSCGKHIRFISSDSEDASSDCDQDETENIKRSDRPSIFPYPSASAEMIPLGLRTEVKDSLHTASGSGRYCKDIQQPESTFLALSARIKRDIRQSKGKRKLDDLKSSMASPKEVPQGQVVQTKPFTHRKGSKSSQLGNQDTNGSSDFSDGDNSVKMFVNTWKEACRTNNVDEVLERMLQFYKVRKKPEVTALFSSYPFRGLLEVTVTFIKHGMWDSLSDNPQTFNQCGVTSTGNENCADSICIEVESPERDTTNHGFLSSSASANEKQAAGGILPRKEETIVEVIEETSALVPTEITCVLDDPAPPADCKTNHGFLGSRASANETQAAGGILSRKEENIEEVIETSALAPIDHGFDGSHVSVMKTQATSGIQPRKENTVEEVIAETSVLASTNITHSRNDPAPAAASAALLSSQDTNHVCNVLVSSTVNAASCSPCDVTVPQDLNYSSFDIRERGGQLSIGTGNYPQQAMLAGRFSDHVHNNVTAPQDLNYNSFDARKRVQLSFGTGDPQQALLTGRLGESVAFKYFVGKFGEPFVKWVNETYETGLPYDLLVAGNEYIEVKATRSVTKDWLHITLREWQFAVEKGELFSIAHVVLSPHNSPKVTVYKNPGRLCCLGKLQLALMIPK